LLLSGKSAPPDLQDSERVTLSEQAIASMTGTGGQGTTPGWYAESLAHKRDVHRFDCKGAKIEAIGWGERGSPGLLFIHGMLAHARWWDFIAPLLADRFRCAALSFSGMGASQSRSRYSMRIYADEILATIDRLGLKESARKPVLVAHSFGAFPARRLAEWQGHELGGLVILDSQIRPTSQYTPLRKTHTLRPYSTMQEALARFRLAPPQICENQFLVDHVASTGLRMEAGCWLRTFDPLIRTKIDPVDYHAGLGEAGCPIAFIYGDRSDIFNEQTKAYVASAYPEHPRIEIPNAAHHVMLDQPLALVAALRSLLSVWPARNEAAF
jgi:pimeloyl-ACP methyl ester carboxylesterase